MKKLIVIRHAEAENKPMGSTDFERELSPNGIEQALKAGSILHNYLKGNFYVLASQAKRTSHTAAIITNALGYSSEIIRFEKEIYQASCDTLIKLLAEIPDEYTSAILIGHNPGVHYLVEYLSGKSFSKFPPCSMAGFKFESSSWGKINAGEGQLFLNTTD